MLRLITGLGIGLAFLFGQAYGQMSSAFIGGWPGVCENNACHDDGQPLSDPPASTRERVLEHQLVSPTCPTDLIYLVFKHPTNTGGPPLDQRLAKEMAARFAEAQKWAQTQICADFFGCDGECLPVGLEIKHYAHQSGPGYLSIFRVERLNGNKRQGYRLKGSTRYSFHNYRLADGGDLTLEEIFPEPAKSLPLFWAKVEKSLLARQKCPLTSYSINDHRVKTTVLAPNDLILSRLGATIALTGRSPCQSQAVDIATPEMLAIGANPALWGR
ncbi:MAG: hypothetical protein LBS60_00875 [Deltaproteobacteria bacterium]|jgi:hypothetical protein|nr:hypothetical protein [Deltaproteobacteria bacterium]